jgi:hypothetical protein
VRRRISSRMEKWATQWILTQPGRNYSKKRPRCSEARFLPFNSSFGTAEVAAFLLSAKTIRERRDRSDTFRPNFAGGGSKEEARKGVICLQRVDERRSVDAALGRTSHTANPRSPPEGFRNPAQPAPKPMPWAGFS